MVIATCSFFRGAKFAKHTYPSINDLKRNVNVPAVRKRISEADIRLQVCFNFIVDFESVRDEKGLKRSSAYAAEVLKARRPVDNLHDCLERSMWIFATEVVELFPRPEKWILFDQRFLLLQNGIVLVPRSAFRDVYVCTSASSWEDVRRRIEKEIFER